MRSPFVNKVAGLAFFDFCVGVAASQVYEWDSFGESGACIVSVVVLADGAANFFRCLGIVPRS
jgi:hypothetical protein